MDQKEKLTKEILEWTAEYNNYLTQHPERKDFKNFSEIPLKPLYTPLDLDNFDYLGKLGFPGKYPNTRGVYTGMYRTRTWSKRLLVGFEGPELYNQRQREMFEAGQSAINFIPCNTFFRGFDVDTVDKQLVGTCGTPVNILQDMDISLRGIPLDEISAAFNDSGPFTAVAMYFALAEERGIPLNKLMGTTNQSDFFSHYVGCNMYFRLTLEGHLRTFIDHVKFCTHNVPNWHPVSIIGHHFQDSGGTPVQALAFALASGIFYVEQLIKSGLDVDSFAPRLSFFFAASTGIFDEIAKFRAGRRMWPKIMRERFGAKKDRSLQFRFHVQSLGTDLTRQQPLNNITRVCIQALSAILGGAQSIHTDSYDEAFQTPTEETARIALMTQNIIEEESGAADVIDPLGGSYYLEKLTDETEERAWEYIDKIEKMGGMFEAVRTGYIQSLIGESAYKYQKGVDDGSKVIVGVNKYMVPDEQEIKPKWIKTNISEVERHVDRVRLHKENRDKARLKMGLDELRNAARDEKENLFAATLNAVKNGVTHGEIVEEMRNIYGYGLPLTKGI
jgi:methylmalonyl-CoA mutase, N-terminal domain